MNRETFVKELRNIIETHKPILGISRDCGSDNVIRYTPSLFEITEYENELELRINDKMFIYKRYSAVIKRLKKELE